MKKIYRYIALAAVTIGFAACTQEEDFAPQQSDIVQIASAHIATEVHTRVNTDGNGDAFETGDAILLVNNSRTDKNEGTYTYDGSEWWPNTTGGMVLWASGTNSFTAYYPASETFELPTDQSTLDGLKSADRMTATFTANTRDAVSLSFSHVNAKVTITTSFASQYDANATISDLKIGGISPYIVDNAYTAILEPTENGFTVKLNVNGTELTATSSATLEKGKHYTFTLTVGKSVATLGEVSVEKWGTTDPLTGGEATEVPMATYTQKDGIAVITVPENALASSFTSAVAKVTESLSSLNTIVINGTLTADQQTALATALASFTDGTLVLDMKQDAVTNDLQTLVDVYEGRTIEEADEVTTYQVYTANGLYAWATATETDATTGLKLMADITLPNKDADGKEITVTDGVPSGSNWTPVGTLYNPYKGDIDGNGKTITGLRINSETRNTGFVGNYNGSEIKYLHLGDGVVYSTANAVGGIAGQLDSGTITYCANHATISGNGYVGGIVGTVVRGDVTGCTNTGNVTGSWSVGGIVGHGQRYTKGGLDNDYVISGCVNSGTVTGEGTDTGGIIGIINSNMYTVIACVNTGEVVNGGGIVGENGGKVVACYTTQNSVAVNNEVGKDTDYHHIGSIEATYYLGEDDSIEGTNGVSDLNTDEVVNAMNVAISAWTDSDGNACAYMWQIGTTYPELVANTAN